MAELWVVASLVSCVTAMLGKKCNQYTLVRVIFRARPRPGPSHARAASSRLSLWVQAVPRQAALSILVKGEWPQTDWLLPNRPRHCLWWDTPATITVMAPIKLTSLVTNSQQCVKCSPSDLLREVAGDHCLDETFSVNLLMEPDSCLHFKTLTT